MNKEVIGILFIPIGIISMCMAALWQMYVMMTETYTLNRFKDKELVWRVALLFISFSLAVYLLCPNSRKKGIVFLSSGAAAQSCICLRGCGCRSAGETTIFRPPKGRLKRTGLPFKGSLRAFH